MQSGSQGKNQNQNTNEILEKNNIQPIHRQGGDKTLKELGL